MIKLLTKPYTFCEDQNSAQDIQYEQQNL